jgi:hypothetical protein
MHRSKQHRYSITSSARPISGSGTVRPSAAELGGEGLSQADLFQ